MAGWRALLREDARDFLRAHEDDDLGALALAPFPLDPGIRVLVLDQIKARRRAREKLPRWHRADGVIFPRSALVEQASSEAAAAYKARLARGGRFVDLTAGVGVDTAAWSSGFAAGSCVEPDPDAYELLRHNLPLVAATPIEVVAARAEDHVAAMPRVDLAYLDPQRRDEHGRRGFRLDDGRPDPLALISRLAGKAARVVLKCSPMLDIASAVAALGGVVEVHIVEWRGECREVLYLIDPGAAVDEAARRIRCVAIADDGAERAGFAFTAAEERAATATLSPPRHWLVEPGPALMKAGAFDLVAARHGLGKLHPSTHLYTCDELTAVPASLPARVFELVSVLRVDAKELAVALPDRRARLKLRNFPGAPAELQRRLGLAEGGEEALFACTLSDGRPALLLARPVPR
jgi:hypothetical protein